MKFLREEFTNCKQYFAEMAKIHTSFNQVQVQILMYKKTLVKIEVQTTLFTQVKVKKYGL